MICHVADSKQVDLVLIGRRGLGIISRFFLDSTSQFVLENCNRNVMIVKPHEEYESPFAQKEEEESHLVSYDHDISEFILN